MKTTFALVLAATLFCTVTFADGDMGGGGFAYDVNAPETSRTGSINGDNGDMGGGGKTCPPGQTCIMAGGGIFDSILETVRGYLDGIF